MIEQQLYGHDLKSMDEIRVFWETYLDVLKQKLPGVEVTLKYDDKPGHNDAADDRRGVEITASW